MGNFNAQRSPFLINSGNSQIEKYSHSDSSKGINIVEKPCVKPLFLTLYFDGSKSSDGAGAGFILISPEGEQKMLTCRLEFECMNNTSEYEALVRGLYKAIDHDVK